MTRVSSQKIRQALLSLGDPLDPDILPERLQLFNEAGEPLMIGTELGRHEQELTTAVIDSSENTFLTWNAFPAIRLYKIATDRPARVRVYPDDTFRAADVARPIGTRPRGNNGRLLEVVTTPDMLEISGTSSVVWPPNLGWAPTSTS
jgi:hypothetical protein